MMKKPKKPIRFGGSILIASLALAAVLFACSQPDEETEMITDQAVVADDGKISIVEISPNEDGGMEELMTYRDTHGKWPDVIKVVDPNYHPKDEKKDAIEQKGENPVFRTVETMPEFPGGVKALMFYLQENIKYPEQAKKEGIKGKVFVQFIIGKDGSIEDAHVLRGIGGGCDEEALRVVKNMPNWKPGMEKGKPVRVQYNIPIKFALD